jgi:hypothetical protein
MGTHSVIFHIFEVSCCRQSPPAGTSCAGRDGSSALAGSCNLMEDIFTRFLLLTPFLFFLLGFYFTAELLPAHGMLFIFIVASLLRFRNESMFSITSCTCLLWFNFKRWLSSTTSWPAFSAKSHPRSILSGFPNWGTRCIIHICHFAFSP